VLVIAFLISKIGPMLPKGGPQTIAGMLIAWVCMIIISIIWKGSIASVIGNLFGSLYDGGDESPEPKPLYSIAISKRKLDKPLEAIVAVREQLAKFPDDYEGVILLASIQAEDTKDLLSAEMTLNHFCESKSAPPQQIAAALTQLADWHLKLAQDSDSARVALERIIEKFPDSPLALVAKQRIAHLGGVEKILLAAHDRQGMFVPKGIQNAGLRDSIRDLIPADANPAELANFYVKHLAQHPHDTEAREKLAIIYAGHYKRIDMATIELEQLINEPNHPPKRVAYWLNLLADFQIRSGADYETVRPTLEKIIARFPGLPVAELAQSRLNRLKLEIKGQKETPGKTLGVYEQNIGLKYGRPFDSPH
jgi:outer membrane protein assembly factor BamD (BamD/ComL family)